jgi:CelD/BcsL family acetyltransferase involved in cellulose biosynthesis
MKCCKTVRVSVIRGRDLTAEHVQAWSAIQSANSALESPFFCPEFTLALAQSAGNIFVGILHDPAGKDVGYFPFELLRPGFGKNLEMCDHQGVIAPATLEYDAADLIKSCGLNVLEFDHFSSANQPFRKYYCHTAESPLLDLTQGFAAYKASLNPDGKRHLAKTTSTSRKVQREIGPLVLVDNCTDAQVMQTMHSWRAQKYGPLPGWAHQALEQMRTTNTPAFAGVLSALYAGEKLIAVHFGIRSRKVLHWWFPAYDPELSNYAPGIQLMLNMAERGPALGITKIDLGKGQQDYKRRFRNATATVASGSVDVLSFSNLPRIVHRNCSKLVRGTPGLLNFARQVKRMIAIK